MYNPDYRVLIGYVFPSEGNPWIADWQENRNYMPRPWNGQVIARGIEFGSSLFDEGLRKSVERGSFLGAPAYRWIGGRQRLANEFTIVLAEGSRTPRSPARSAIRAYPLRSISSRMRSR